MNPVLMKLMSVQNQKKKQKIKLKILGQLRLGQQNQQKIVVNVEPGWL